MWGKYENIQAAAQNVANAGDGEAPNSPEFTKNNSQRIEEIFSCNRKNTVYYTRTRPHPPTP